MDTDIQTCAACGQRNRIAARPPGGGDPKCGRCGALLGPAFLHPDVVRFAPRAGHIRYPLEAARYPVSVRDWNMAHVAGAPLRLLPAEGGEFRCALATWDEAQAYVSFLNERRGLAGRPDRFRLPWHQEIDSFLRELDAFESTWRFWCDSHLETPKKLDPREKIFAPIWPDTYRHVTGMAGAQDRKTYAAFRLVRSIPPEDAGQAPPAPERIYRYDAFLSHNQGDGSAELAKALERLGVSVWHDGDADMSDQRVIDVVFGAIREARLLCVCIGPDFRESQWVREEYELGLASEHGMGAIRVAAVELAPGVSVPVELSQKLRIPAWNGPDLLAAYLLAANSRTETGTEWMVRADHARLLRDSALALKFGPERYVTRQGRTHETWIGIAEREKLEAAYRRHIEAAQTKP